MIIRLGVHVGGVDTSVAHLAGALGRPTWICLAAGPEWRWMLDRTDTLWYGSARLFRQPRVGDWSTVFAEVAAELRQLASTRRADPRIPPDARPDVG